MLYTLRPYSNGLTATQYFNYLFLLKHFYAAVLKVALVNIVKPETHKEEGGA